MEDERRLTEDSPSADTRTKRQKMEAMASQTASPREAAIAQTWLDSHPRRTLSRDDILSAPDLRAAVGSAWVWDPRLRVRVLMDLDDPAFVGLHLVYDDDEFWDEED